MLVLLVLLFTCMQIRCSSRIPPSLGFPATASASPVAIRIASKTKVSMIKDLNWRMPLAGGLAGGLATFILYPIDAVKSLCQSNPTISLGSIINMLGKGSAYAGVLPAALGAVPSSAVYFGTYEAFKRLFADTFHDYAKPLQHMCAAASGNLLSSSIFVPKDVLKHTVQAIQSGSVQINGFGPNNCNIFRLIRHLYNTKGLKAFYPSYRVTLLKNVPSAIVRFSVYEELKLLVPPSKDVINLWYMVAGGIASALSSALTTPFDVVKTRIASGMLPPGSPILQAIASIYKQEGLRGVYAGVETRLLWAGLFGGVGFASFEAFKRMLEVGGEGDSKD